MSMSSATNGATDISGRFLQFCKYIRFRKSISGLTPMTSCQRFFNYSLFPGILGPLWHFCNHFQFWNSTSGPTRRTGKWKWNAKHAVSVAQALMRAKTFLRNVAPSEYKMAAKILLLLFLTANFDFSHLVSS